MNFCILRNGNKCFNISVGNPLSLTDRDPEVLFYPPVWTGVTILNLNQKSRKTKFQFYHLWSQYWQWIQAWTACREYYCKAVIGSMSAQSQHRKMSALTATRCLTGLYCGALHFLFLPFLVINITCYVHVIVCIYLISDMLNC